MMNSLLWVDKNGKVSNLYPATNTALATLSVINWYGWGVAKADCQAGDAP